MNGRFSDRIEDIPSSGIRRFFDLVSTTKGVISLGVGEPDFATPWEIRNEAILCIENGQTAYTSNSGTLECRAAISDYLKSRFKAIYQPKNEILLTVGVSEAVDLAFRTILNPGDEVIIPEPNYVCYSPLILMTGATAVGIDTSNTGFIPTVECLRHAITPKTKAIVLCSPNNPTGAVIPKDILEGILALAKKHHLWIISDEIYAELSYTPYTSFASLEGAHAHCILLNGFSKAYAMTGWRLGYMCGPESFIQRAIKIHQYGALCAPTIAQHAAAYALLHPELIEPMRKSYELRRNLIHKRLNEIGLPTMLPQGAFYCFPSIKSTGLSSEDFALQLLQHAKVAVVPGSVFGLGGEGYVRCCYATHIDLLKTAMARIDKFIKSL